MARAQLPARAASRSARLTAAAVADGDLHGVSSSSKKAAKELDDFRKRLEHIAAADSDGPTSEEIAQIEVALKEIDGDASPPDAVTGEGVPRLVEILTAMLEGLSN